LLKVYFNALLHHPSIVDITALQYEKDKYRYGAERGRNLVAVAYPIWFKYIANAPVAAPSSNAKN
jgi:hypothetical protein